MSPSRMASSAVNPSAASIAARSPVWAACPGWRGLVIEPKFFFSADDPDATMPNAWVRSPGARSRTLAAAAAAPNEPMVPVWCQPWS
jgi:hypothetical protein